MMNVMFQQHFLLFLHVVCCFLHDHICDIPYVSLLGDTLTVLCTSYSKPQRIRAQ